MLQSPICFPKVLVIGDADLQRFCRDFGIISPIVVKIDIEDYGTYKELINAVGEVARVENPDFILIASEEGDIVLDVSGIVAGSVPSGYFVSMVDRKKGGFREN